MYSLLTFATFSQPQELICKLHGVLFLHTTIDTDLDINYKPAEIAIYISVIFFGIAVAISTAYNNAP
jgi:hypothetical protein